MFNQLLPLETANEPNYFENYNDRFPPAVQDFINNNVASYNTEIKKICDANWVEHHFTVKNSNKLFVLNTSLKIDLQFINEKEKREEIYERYLFLNGEVMSPIRDVITLCHGYTFIDNRTFNDVIQNQPFELVIASILAANSYKFFSLHYLVQNLSDE